MNASIRQHAEARLSRRTPYWKVKKSPVLLSTDEFTVVRDALPAFWHRHADFLALGAARLNETAAVFVCDVDPDTAGCEISKTWMPTRDGWKIRPNKYGRRVIRVPEALIDSLDLDRPGDELLFTTRSGGAVLGHRYAQVWRRALADLLDGHDESSDPLHGKRPRPQDVRWSCAEWLLSAGASLPSVVAYLGLARIDTLVPLIERCVPELGAKLTGVTPVVSSPPVSP
ncbi:hypothetical protein OG874_35855 [Nocardia sp. NBC_00565]|uniref:hypothetical protein n=1 Tax=Nocardia sp. NBC_00565 TaxID=2975993 RepID=UPI002E82488A|nr:hypothetical protein [Nocardia sp. NBC_00565]WUC02067.1 hypothetical protein OG874_35855 [Nocardia sp. NBC_00565]